MSVISVKGDWYEDRPWILAIFSAETCVHSDRSFVVRSKKSCEKHTQQNVGDAMEGRHQAITFSQNSRHSSLFAANAWYTCWIEDWLDCEYFTELLEGRRSSTDVSKPIADDSEEAIDTTSTSYTRSTKGRQKWMRMSKPLTSVRCCGVGFERYHLMADSEQRVLVSW